MKIIWREYIHKPEVRYLATFKEMPMAKMMSELSVPEEYPEIDKEWLERKGITVEKEFSGTISCLFYLFLVLRNWSDEQIVKAYCGAGSNPFDIERLSD